MQHYYYSIAVSCENALIEAIVCGKQFTTIGYIEGKLHVPEFGLVL